MNTKKILADTFWELLKDKSFENIAVKEISIKSGCSRKTIYNHFRDKYDIMMWKYLDFVNETFELDFKTNSYFSVIDKTCEFLDINKAVIQKLLQYEGQNSFYYSLYDYAYQNCCDCIRLSQRRNFL